MSVQRRANRRGGIKPIGHPSVVTTGHTKPDSARIAFPHTNHLGGTVDTYDMRLLARTLAFFLFVLVVR
jgi:hypothetical protein